MGKPGVQKTLFLSTCLITIHNFRNDWVFFVKKKFKKFDNIMSFHKIFWKKLLAFFV